MSSLLLTALRCNARTTWRSSLHYTPSRYLPRHQSKVVSGLFIVTYELDSLHISLHCQVTTSGKWGFRTLDPSRLLPSDFINLSGRQHQPFVYFRGQDCLTFPAGTAGFFYYHNPLQDVLPMSGETRFRITPSNDPSTFALGTDLLTPRSIPWGLPLITSHRKCYEPMVESLLQDNVVTKEIIQQCAAVGVNSAVRKGSSSIIHALGQPFYVKLDATEMFMHIMASDHCRDVTFYNLFVHREPISRRYIRPFSGK
jgi:hypothetical protein